LRKGTFFSFLQSFCRCREKRLAGAAPKFHGIAHRRECCQQAFA
jgi:hypothetical protein